MRTKDLKPGDKVWYAPQKGALHQGYAASSYEED